ncbi:hypothetical protein [Novosphingobium terrae]|uniref:hypothetical protein n=1 Tax=Novosphingobium terrae TaxID=2726189 RepID=UPI001981B38F|nr:hypothetical protein [Novosphingobium terrae]
MLLASSPGPTRDTLYLTSSAPQTPLSWEHRDWTAPWLDLRWGARPAPSLEQRAFGRDILKAVERRLSIGQLNYVPDKASDARFDHLSSHISWFQIDEFRTPSEMAWLPGVGPKTRMLVTARPSRIEISLLNQTVKFLEIDIPREPVSLGSCLDAEGAAAEVRASMSLLDLDYASVSTEHRNHHISAIVDKFLSSQLSRELDGSRFNVNFALTRPGEPLSATGSVEECDLALSEARPRRFGLTPDTQARLVSQCDSLHFNVISTEASTSSAPFTQVRVADTMPFSAVVSRNSFLLPPAGATAHVEPLIFSYDDPGMAPSDTHQWCRPRWTIDLSRLPDASVLPPPRDDWEKL